MYVSLVQVLAHTMTHKVSFVYQKLYVVFGFYYIFIFFGFIWCVFISQLTTEVQGTSQKIK